ncbi:MAG TPA: CDP-glucose 4,6-dehydratase [Hyphomicrobiales bacterium]|nr:CDP-glucose 4,6-dehydratase [Hyphomicrobiales bacterium]
MALDNGFWRGRRVLLTGHTGFKGGWAAFWLKRLGAAVTGLALAPDTEPDLWTLARVGDGLHSHIADLRDPEAVAAVVREARPELVLHMAAQPLVRRSYAAPVETFATNVIGTVHLLEALRDASGLRAVLVVTSDKVYANAETGRAFAEGDALGGHDPYAASKAAAELVTASYAASFFAGAGVQVATARGGNVMGGGDFAADRLVPDAWRAARAGRPLVLRHPGATRPWQHVLDCVAGYLAYLQALGAGRAVPRALNFGPATAADPVTVSQIAEAVQRALGAPAGWVVAEDAAADPRREMAALALDPAAAQRALGWRCRLSTGDAVRFTADWYRALAAGADMAAVTGDQIAAYERLREPA